MCKSYRREITEGARRVNFLFFLFFSSCKSAQCTEGPVLFSSRGKLSSVHSGAKGVRFLMRRNPMSPLVKYKQGPHKRVSKEQARCKGAEASIPLHQSEEGSHRCEVQAITLERSKHEAQSRSGASLLLASLPKKLTKIPSHESEGWKVLSRESRRLGATSPAKEPKVP